MTVVDTEGPGLGDLLAMSVTLAMYLVVGFGLGWLVDLPLNSFPAAALVGLALGMVASGRYFYKQYKRFQ